MNKNININITVTVKRLVLIFISSLISAIGVNMFFAPHKLLSSGVGGIGLIVQYLTNIPSGYIVILINLPLFILCFKEMDRQFTILTVIGTITQAVLLIVTKNISHYFYVKDFLLSCIYGGVLYGIAAGLILSFHSSFGGIEIISVILRKKYDYDVGIVNFCINVVILSIGSAFFGIETGLYTIMSIYIGSYVIDKVIKGFDRKKLLFIITNKEMEITVNIKKELKRYSTFLDAESAHTGKKYKIIYCVVPLGQVPKVKHIVNTIDPHAFISILDTSEVQGKGFKNVI